jgi:hypothetical protein
MTKKDADNIKYEFTYIIDHEIDVQFFKNPKFFPYLINYIRQETFSLEIEIKRVDPKNDESVLNYAIKFIATKEQNRVIRSFIKRLFESAKFKTYNKIILKKCSLHPKSIDIIQNVLNNETHLFTVCQWRESVHQKLEIWYFDDEKFNSPENLTKIDDIIQNQILQENILLSSIKNTQIIELMDINTHKILSTHQVCQTQRFEQELKEIITSYEQDHMLVSIIRYQYHLSMRQAKDTIELFGYKKSVDEILQKFKNLIDKYRLRKFTFTQLSSPQVCLCFICLFYILMKSQNECPSQVNQSDETYEIQVPDPLTHP